MSRHLLSLLLLVALLVAQSPILKAFQAEPALVYVALSTHEELLRFQKTGLPVYVRLYGNIQGDSHGGMGSYVLLGANETQVEMLKAAGLSIRVLDQAIDGARYYLSYENSRLAVDWTAYGDRLLDDGVQSLWRLSPQAVERLLASGAELSALPRQPRPLAPAFVPGIVPAVVEPDPIIESMIDQVSRATVEQYVGELSGERPAVVAGRPFTLATRYTYSGVYIDKATQYVGAHLKDLGLDVEYYVWGAENYPDVIGELRGETHPDDVYIICAHIDDAPFEGVAPGADDNASGSAAVLLAADILSQYRWGCTLRFILFTGEEQWSMEEYYAHGSYPYAARSRTLGENLVATLNLDMLGWNSEKNPAPDIDLEAKASPTLSPTVALAQLFADVVHTYDLNLVPQVSANSSGLGDHGSFWDHGYIAIMGIEDMLDFNPYYHSAQDRLQFLDKDYMTEFIKAGVGTFAHMSGCLLQGEWWKVYLPLTVRGAD